MLKRYVYLKAAAARLGIGCTDRKYINGEYGSESRFAKLIVALTNDGRSEDIVHMAADTGFRDSLYEKYGIR